MNINLKFENVTWQKKIGYLFIGIAVCLFAGIALVVMSVLFNHYDKQVTSAKEQAELVSASITEEIENITDSLEYISNLISDEEMKSHISSNQVTSLLNQLISKDEKVFGAFVMLDKDEYAEIEEETKEISPAFKTSKEADEALDILENNDELEAEEAKEVVVERDSIVDGVNKFVYKANGSTFETNLDRLNTLEYKKSYMKVMLTKEPQMMAPQTNTYNGQEVTTVTYTVPIIVDGDYEGIIGIDIDLEVLKEELNAKSESLTNDYIIVDKKGNIIGASRKSLEDTTIQSVYKGSNHKKTLEYIETNLETAIGSTYNTGSIDFLHDEVLIMLPVILEENHVWNIIFMADVDKVVTNSMATILLVSIINLILFALFIVLLWLSFGTIVTKKYNTLFNRVDKELEKIKANSTKIMEDLEDIEEITVLDSDVDDAVVSEIDTEIKEEIKEEAKQEEAKIEEIKAEEVKEETLAPEEPKIEEVKEETETVEDNGFDASAFAQARQETDEKYQAAEDLKTPEEKAAEAAEAETKKKEEDLNDILANKEGDVASSDELAEAEAKLAKAMGNNEEPKVEEPKIEEPKIEEPKIEEPKIEEPKPAPAPAPAPAPKPQPKAVAMPEVDMDKPIGTQAAAPREKDYYSVKLEPEEDDFTPREHKLTNKEMDELLKEIEGKRRAEAEAQGVEYQEINVEESGLSDILGSSASSEDL